MAAAKLCASSIYASLAGVVLWFLPFFRGASLLGAAVGIGLGTLGLMKLARVGMGPPLTPDLRGLERVAVRYAARARPQAGFGIAIGVLLLTFFVYTWWAGNQRAKERQENFEAMLEDLRHAETDFGADRPDRGGSEPSAAEQREIDAWIAFDDISERMARPDFTPEDPLPEAEIAQQLKAFLKAHPGSEPARDIVSAEFEPCATMRRILKAHGWTPPSGEDASK